MTEEALNKLKAFRQTEGDLIVWMLEETTPKIKQEYGPDAAVGFVLALDLMYFALTGKDLKNISMNKNKGEKNEQN